MCQCPSHFGRFECTNCIRLKWRINSIVNNSQFYYLHAILIKFANDTDKCQNRIHKQHEKWHAPITIVLLCAFVPIQFRCEAQMLFQCQNLSICILTVYIQNGYYLIVVQYKFFGFYAIFVEYRFNSKVFFHFVCNYICRIYCAPIKTFNFVCIYCFVFCLVTFFFLLYVLLLMDKMFSRVVQLPVTNCTLIFFVFCFSLIICIVCIGHPEQQIFFFLRKKHVNIISHIAYSYPIRQL